MLKVIRKKQTWPACVGTDLAIGSRGFRGFGYHEKLNIPMYSSTKSPMPHQQLVVRYKKDPTNSKPNRQAVNKRGAADTSLPRNKVFKQAELENLSFPQQFWMHASSALPAANTYNQPYDVMLQNQIARSSLLGMNNQPLVVPNGYFKPIHVLCEQSIAPGRLAFDNGQPRG